MAASTTNLATAAQRRAGLASSRLPSSVARAPLVDGSGDGMALVAVPKTASQYIPATSSGGTISMDVVVISSPSSRTNDSGTPGMPPLVTHTFLVVPIHDTPDPPASVTGVAPANNLVRSEQRISINDKDLIEWDKHNPHMFWVIGSGIVPEQAHLKGQDKRKADRGKYAQCKVAIARGRPVEIQTNAVSKLDGAKEVNVGDVLQLSNVNYKIDHSIDSKTKAVTRYENLHVGNLKRIGSWVDVPHMHNDIFFTLTSILPHYMPNFPTLVVDKEFDPSAATAKGDAARRAAAEEAARAHAEAHQLEYVPPSAAASQGKVELLKKPSEKSKMIEASLTEASKIALRQFPFVVPKYVPCPEVGNYLAAQGIKHWKTWENADSNNMLLEPAAMECYNFDATDANKDASGGDATRKDLSYGEQRDGKTIKLVPKLRYASYVKQALPDTPQYWEKLDESGKPIRPEDGAQDVVVSVSNTGTGLYAFGTAEPQLMGRVAPVLYSGTPAVNICYASNKERIVASSEEGKRLEYLLGGVVKVSDWKGKGGQPATTRNAVSIFADLAAGIVSRGYAIDKATADKFIKIKQNMPGVGKTRVSDNMAHSTTKNEYAEENPIGKKNVRSPVQNLFETGINWRDAEEHENFQPFLVSNWALKDFVRSPQLEAMYAAMRVFKEDGTTLDEKATAERAIKFHSKLLVDIAEGRFPRGMSKKERLEDPAASTTNEEDLAKYAEKLREYAGFAKGTPFPIAAVDIPEVFGPMHLLGEENDSSAQARRPFEFILFAIRHEYLRDRRMTNYIGDNWYFDVLYELYGAAYKRVVASIDEGKTVAYSKWIEEGAKKPDAVMTEASGSNNKRKDPPAAASATGTPVPTAIPKNPTTAAVAKGSTGGQVSSTPPPAKVAKSAPKSSTKQAAPTPAAVVVDPLVDSGAF